MIRPTLTLPAGAREQFKQRTREAALRAARNEHNRLATDWNRALRRIIAEEFARREGARHKPGTIHLDDSFTVTVDADDFPVETTLRTKNGVSSAKVRSLNSGSRPHEIEPRSGNDQLAWRTPQGNLFRTPKVGRPSTAVHPGTRASRFLERSRDEALARRAT